MPREERDQIRTFCVHGEDVDAAWDLWSTFVEDGLLRAYRAAGGSLLSSIATFLGRCRLSIRTRRMGGLCNGRIYRPDHADPIDVASARFFPDSSFSTSAYFGEG